MTICFPDIINSQICPSSELDFATAPATCVRVVALQGNAQTFLSASPPNVHFLVTGDGTVFQLAPITPTHALLESDTCVRVGVLFGSAVPLGFTQQQRDVLPGVLRHVLVTLNLTTAALINALPTNLCRRSLWQDIVQDTIDCLGQSPPNPIVPGINCTQVRGCFSAGQNIALSSGGVISAGQLVDNGNGTYSWILPTGATLFTLSSGGSYVSGQNISIVGNVINAGQATLTTNVSGDYVLEWFDPNGNPLWSFEPHCDLPTDALSLGDTMSIVGINTSGCMRQFAAPNDTVPYVFNGDFRFAWLRFSDQSVTLWYDFNFLSVQPTPNNYYDFWRIINTNGTTSIANSLLSDIAGSDFNIQSTSTLGTLRLLNTNLFLAFHSFADLIESNISTVSNSIFMAYQSSITNSVIESFASSSYSATNDIYLSFAALSGTSVTDSVQSSLFVSVLSSAFQVYSSLAMLRQSQVFTLNQSVVNLFGSNNLSSNFSVLVGEVNAPFVTPIITRTLLAAQAQFVPSPLSPQFNNLQNAVVAGDSISFVDSDSTNQSVFAVGRFIEIPPHRHKFSFGIQPPIELYNLSVELPVLAEFANSVWTFNATDGLRLYGNGMLYIYSPFEGTTFSDDLAAQTALSAYSGHPNLLDGTLARVRVNGRQALFAWDAATFTWQRITV